MRHAVWHHDDTCVSLRAGPEYLRAERVLRFRLSHLGVGAGTGELQLAAQLLAAWASDQPYAAVRRRWRAMPAARETFPDRSSMFWVFPEAVALVETLTDPGFITYLLSPAWSAVLQSELLVASATGVAGEAPPEALSGLAARIVEHGSEGVRVAYGIVGTRRKRSKATIERALVAAARSHRSCLLRHLDTGRLPAGRYGEPVRYIAHARVLATSDYLPDEVW